MSSIPDLRLAPLRMVSPAEMRGPLLDSMSRGKPAAGLHQTVALPAQGAQEPEPRDAQKPPLGITGPEASAKAKAAPAPFRQRFDHPERMDPFDEPPAQEFSFYDFLDIINPLQHIPIISTIYRAITGDEIGGPARIMGGLLFGGPIGFIASIFNTIMEDATGRDLGETVVAAFMGEDEAPETLLASADNGEETGPGPAIAALGQGPAGEHEPFGISRISSFRQAALPTGPSVADGPAGAGRWVASAAPATPLTIERVAARQVAVTELETPLHAAASSRSTEGGPAENPAVAVSRAVAATPGPGAATALGIDLKGGPPAPAGPEGSASPLVVPVPGSGTGPFAAPLDASTRIGQPSSTALSDRAFADRMMQALDKYKAIVIERNQDSPRANRRVDLKL